MRGFGSRDGSFVRAKVGEVDVVGVGVGVDMV
jgi:hypothetical protein